MFYKFLFLLLKVKVLILIILSLLVAIFNLINPNKRFPVAEIEDWKYYNKYFSSIAKQQLYLQ